MRNHKRPILLSAIALQLVFTALPGQSQRVHGPVEVVVSSKKAPVCELAVAEGCPQHSDEAAAPVRFNFDLSPESARFFGFDAARGMHLLPTPSWLQPDTSSPGSTPRLRRDRRRGAEYGLGIGALVGGLGFASLNYAFTTNGPRGEYTAQSLLLGGVVGGVAGAIVGAIIGAPARSTESPSRVQLRLSSGTQSASAMISVPR